MASIKFELRQLQITPGRTSNPEPMIECARRYRKILVFSPDNERLAAVFESLSNNGHSCLFAKKLGQAKEMLANPEIGFIVADGDRLGDGLPELLDAIKRIRPDIHNKSKIHVFTARYVSELREGFSFSGEGIEPLE